ncbi:hypothetical protein DY000_02060317 [Brassica cretica]|uniref:Uncharacterized protein n=1 Tax=Brassica cretica TaxID=69181 RepID=A0ABQ7B331_BRACR|nr:hypothetical protein DY000_02060317 [Brassica cretica]
MCGGEAVTFAILLAILDVFHPQRPSTVEKKLPRFLEAMGVDMLLLDAKVILFFEVMFIIVHHKLTGKITDLQRIYGITSPEQLSQTADSYTNHVGRWSFELFGYNTMRHLLLEEVSVQLRGLHGQATTAMLQLPEPVADTLPNCPRVHLVNLNRCSS